MRAEQELDRTDVPEAATLLGVVSNPVMQPSSNISGGTGQRSFGAENAQEILDCITPPRASLNSSYAEATRCVTEWEHGAATGDIVRSGRRKSSR